jgi:hypothetical protein
MQGLIWNCRGLKKKGVAIFLKNLISEYSFHVIGIQETMIKDCDEKLLKKFDINKDYLWLYNSALGKSGGILCGVKKDLYDVGSFHQGKYMLQMNLWDKTKKNKVEFSCGLWVCP